MDARGTFNLNFMSHRTADKYSRAIERLRKTPHKIYDAWTNPLLNKNGCLFSFATQDGTNRTSLSAGCLTMIRRNHNMNVPNHPDLTEDIRADETIPESIYDTQVSDLKHFARWQRILDKELNRV